MNLAIDHNPQELARQIADACHGTTDDMPYWRSRLTELLTHLIVAHRATNGPVRTVAELMHLLNHEPLIEDMFTRCVVGSATSPAVADAQRFLEAYVRDEAPTTKANIASMPDRLLNPAKYRFCD